MGILYFFNNIEDETILTRARKQLLVNALPFLVFFLFFLINVLFMDGFGYDSNGVVSMVPYKYFNNLIEMPLNTVILLLGVVAVLWGIYRGAFHYEKCGTKAIWFTGGGTILTVFALLILVGFNNTCFYPSTSDLQSSLTIQNASSSKYTLVAMSYVSLLVPFVVAYIWYAWSSLNKKPITAKEMEDDHHAY